jgi:hypothetical protein
VHTKPGFRPLHKIVILREVEGPRRCLLADALLGFPATNYEEKSKKSQAPSEAEGSAVQYFGPNGFVIPTEANPDFCHAALDKVACAPFRKERRMKFAEATNSTGNPG